MPHLSDPPICQASAANLVEDAPRELDSLDRSASATKPDSAPDVLCDTDAAFTIALSGELTIADTANLRQQLLGALSKDNEVHVDLSRVTYLDAAALQLMWAARKSAIANGTHLTLHSPQQGAIDAAKLLGMESVLVDAKKGVQQQGDGCQRQR